MRIAFHPRRRFANWLLLAVALSLTLIGAGDTDTIRFAKIGHRLMCPCGCAQMLLECNHVGCPDSETMRAQLTAGVSQGASDDAILSRFVEIYGTTVLAAPRKQGFDLIAWIMPFVALALGAVLVVYFVRRWQAGHMRPAYATPDIPSSAFNELRRRAREETEL